MISTHSDRPRKSSGMFGALQKLQKNVRKRSCVLRTTFGESSEICAVGNLRKIIKSRYWYVYV